MASQQDVKLAQKSGQLEPSILHSRTNARASLHILGQSETSLSRSADRLRGRARGLLPKRGGARGGALDGWRLHSAFTAAPLQRCGAFTAPLHRTASMQPAKDKVGLVTTAP